MCKFYMTGALAIIRFSLLLKIENVDVTQYSFLK